MGTDVRVATPYLNGMRVRTLRMENRMSLMAIRAGSAAT